MAVPKTTQTRYIDGSVQRTTQVTPSPHLFFNRTCTFICFAVKLLENGLKRLPESPENPDFWEVDSPDLDNVSLLTPHMTSDNTLPHNRIR